MPLEWLLCVTSWKVSWSKDVHDQADWHRKVEAEAARIAAPIRVTLSTAN
jgi:hypothetical protein